MGFFFLELAPLNLWVDELEKISPDVVALRHMSQLLHLLISHRSCSLADIYLTNANGGCLSRDVVF